jgi:cytidylate kinase
MAATVVCISRTNGAGGELVGMSVAAELGYRYVDREVVLRAAEKANVDAAAIADAERRKSFVQRLLSGLPKPITPAASLAAVDPSAGGDYEGDLRDVIRIVLADLADEGNVVIVSHAASMALAGKPNLLRVLVTASPDVRAKRISHDGQLIDSAAAAAAIREADRNRQDYFRRFYDIHEEEPTHYDLVLSTDVLTERQATAIVCAAARVPPGS